MPRPMLNRSVMPDEAVVATLPATLTASTSHSTRRRVPRVSVSFVMPATLGFGAARHDPASRRTGGTAGCTFHPRAWPGCPAVPYRPGDGEAMGSGGPAAGHSGRDGAHRRWHGHDSAVDGRAALDGRRRADLPRRRRRAAAAHHPAGAARGGRPGTRAAVPLGP